MRAGASVPDDRATTTDDLVTAADDLTTAVGELAAALDRTGVPDERRWLRTRFLDRYADAVYDELTGRKTRRPRMPELVEAAAGRYHALLPAAAGPGDREDLEIDRAVFLRGVLRHPGAGRHLLESMLQPTDRARDLLPGFRATGRVVLRSVRVERRDGVAHLTMTRDDCLNAEDEQQVDDLETAVDLALLDPAVKVGVLRGGEMTGSRYAGRRVFSAGVNLKELHRGRIGLLGFMLRREAGYIAKISRGLPADPELPGSWRAPTVQKPWVAAVDTFAIGGGAQLLLVFDHVIAAADSYVVLPAAQEGIVPGVSNLRLVRAAGRRVAGQMILRGRRIQAREPAGRLWFDEVVEPQEMDGAVERAGWALQAPAVAPNRRMLALFADPADEFRRYLAEFAVEQAQRLYAPDVVAKVGRFSAAPAG